MTGQTEDIAITPAAAVVAAPEAEVTANLDDMVKAFSEAKYRYRGWTYLIFMEGTGEEKRYVHLAVCGETVHKLEYSGLEVMPNIVFEWMVQLGFPKFNDLRKCSHFPAHQQPNFHGMLNKFDVERIWLWHRAKERGASTP